MLVLESEGIYTESIKEREGLKMTFAQRLRELRNRTGMSQEKLAERLGVSRQAITKWETDAGMPEVENLLAISTLFDISVDELLGNEKGAKKEKEYLFESVTEYDIDGLKRYDMKFGGAKRLSLSGYEGEKLRVRLASNQLATLQSDFKVKIDDVRGRIDVELARGSGATEAEAKETLIAFIELPARYIGRIELAVNAQTVEVSSLECEDVELDIKAANVALEDVVGAVEINCNLDMNVTCRAVKGAIAINQLSATSRISVPEGMAFTAVAKGIGTSISYEKDGKRTEPFDTPDAENVIELNGFKSELIICMDA